MNLEIALYILGGALFLLAAVSGVVWQMLRAEAKDHADQIKSKADKDRLIEVETRWAQQLENMKQDNERLVSKLEGRHERELDALASRLNDKMASMETNILAQFRLMISIFKQEGKE